MFIEWELISFNRCSFVITILLDWISLIFIGFVMFISSMVILYREEYISGDLNLNRFIILVIIFVFSIILLIISPNLVRILLGWDGLGLVSYCLVIYYQNVKSYNAGMITALSNRIGDVALLLSIAWILNFGRFNYVFYLVYIKDDFVIQVVTLLVILAAFTKRAQIPFSSWLPAAMAAPTPVSSLVHSSTLVTAGVYLLIRFNYSFRETIKIWILLVSTLTIFISGLGANFEFDLKKVIALSTLRQLGLIMRILFLGSYKLAFFHLLTHAIFKALLFMCAGAIIHNFLNSQDIRFIGGLILQMPITCIFFNISNLALCGFPFLAGFYSKDLILEFGSFSSLNFIIYFLFYFSTGLTMCYSFRLSYYSIVGSLNFSSFFNLRDQGFTMLKGITGLFFIVIFSGSSLIWLLFPSPLMICLPLWIKIMALGVSVLGGWIGYQLSKISLAVERISFSIRSYLFYISTIWYLPFLSTFGVNFYFLRLGNLIFKNFDQGWSEFLGGQGLNSYLVKTSKIRQFFELNNLKIYLILFVLWIFLIFIIFYLNSLILEHNIEDIRVTI